MEDESSCEFKLKLLQKENEDLREVIAVALNKPLLRQLREAVNRIASGEYLTEKEFAKRFSLESH
jgi:hypothetical protein